MTHLLQRSGRMKILVINGTEIKGCTYHIKESFLEVVREGNEITEYYLPKDSPHFCCGCKLCFFKSEHLCPHAKEIMPIWEAMLAADLLVFAYPVYALRAPGQLKALLDHLACHWIAHRPDQRMFAKRAVILTQSVGAPNKAAQSDVATSLTWLGVSDIQKLGFGLMEGVIWDELSAKRRKHIIEQTQRFARLYRTPKQAKMGLKVRGYFMMCRFMHQNLLRHEEIPSADNHYWLDQGWIKR